MSKVYGSNCLAHEKFNSGTETGNQAPWPGQANCVNTDKNIWTVQNLILKNKLLKINVCISSAHSTVFEQLKYRKLRARWVPRQLTLELKQKRIEVYNILLSRYKKKPQPKNVTASSDDVMLTVLWGKNEYLVIS